MSIKRKYTKEFKIEALNLVKELGNVAAAARQLGVPEGTIHTWGEKYNFVINSPPKRTAAHAISETEEIQRLRKENEQLKKTNYILKRAAAFFSQDHLK